MTQHIKYFLHKHLPNSIKYLIIFMQSYQQIITILKKLLSNWRHIRIMKNAHYFDSKNMTYKKVIISTLEECYHCLKSQNLIYFGEVTKGSHRFIITDEKLESIETQLRDLLHNGFIIDIEKNNIRVGTISDKTISSKKFKKKIKNFTLLKIYKIYKNSHGIVEFGSKISFELEYWYKSGDVLITKSKNKIQNKLTEENLNTLITINIFGITVKQLKETYLYFQSLTKVSVQEIDLVYTWVDAEDKKWLKKKSNYMNDNFKEKVHSSAISDNRFISRDELKYSLRSVQKYFLNYRKIFIVTDGQRPEWLRESDELKIVDHTDIFPDKNVLPVFNSHAIEACLHRIEGLSEHYLYLNDDIIFGRSVDVSVFFPEQNKISIFPSNQTYIPFGKPSKNSLPVDTAAMNTRTLLHREDIGYPINKFKHTPLPQLKSKLIELEALFPKEFSITRSSRFRQPSDLSVTSSLLFNYAYLKHHAYKNPINYAYINLDTHHYEFSLNKSTTASENDRPDVFCVNDGDGNLQYNEVKLNFIQIMNNFLPIKSKFEY